MGSSSSDCLGELLAATAKRLPAKEALAFEGERWTWADLDRRVDHLARVFLAWGLQRGDRVAIVCTTRPEYHCAYLAAARIGAVLAGFNSLHPIAELARLAQLTRPAVLVALGKIRGTELAAPLRAAIEPLGCVRHWIVVGEYSGAGWTPFEALAGIDCSGQTRALATRRDQVQNTDEALIVFTSGSTGGPKGVVLTHGNITANIRVQVRQFGMIEQDRILAHLPMSHVSGATEITVPALLTGATLVLMEHFHPQRALEIVQRERITFLGQVPTMFIMELNLPDFAKFDLSSLRALVVAGAATPLPVMERLIALGPTVFTGYGLTEVAGFVTYSAPDDEPALLASTVGRVAPEFELRIVDDQHRRLPTGAMGEVALRGACVMKEYLAEPEETAAALDGAGWFYTGDIGRLGEKGNLTLVDRKKEIYITGGYNVSPREVEAHLSQHPAVALAAVVGRPDDVMGEVGMAFVVPKPSSPLTEQDLRAHCEVELADYKIPRRFMICEALPLTPLGKVDKTKLPAR